MPNLCISEGIFTENLSRLHSLQINFGTLAHTEFDAAGRHKSQYNNHLIERADVQPSGTDVVARTAIVHVAKCAGVVKSCRVPIDDAPAGGDLEFTADFQRSTAGGAWTSLLTGVVTIDSAKTDRTITDGTLAVANTPYLAGDMFRIVWAVSGSTGTQGQRAAAQMDLEENGS